jgi:aromatic-L-amino-acid decarboxylase
VGTVRNNGSGSDRSIAGAWAILQGTRLWFHVDGAWGGSAILSPKLRHHLAGIEARIRSPATRISGSRFRWDAACSSAAILKRVAEAFRADVSYMPGKKVGPVFDPYTTSAQWSRRFIGLKLFMALAQQGESGYAEMIEHQTCMGRRTARGTRASGWRIVNSTPLPLVCFTREGLVPASFWRLCTNADRVDVGGAAW